MSCRKGFSPPSTRHALAVLARVHSISCTVSVESICGLSSNTTLAGPLPSGERCGSSRAPELEGITAFSTRVCTKEHGQLEAHVRHVGEVGDDGVSVASALLAATEQALRDGVDGQVHAQHDLDALDLAVV